MRSVAINVVLSSPVGGFIVVCGLILGSFLNVCIYRLPLGIFWQSSRSFCPSCQKTIPFYYNIPVLSYLILRGRSACCQARISPAYPLVELFTAFGLAVIYAKFPFLGLHLAPLQFSPDQGLRFLHGALLFAYFVTLSGIDIKHRIIPDVLSIPMLLLSLVMMAIHPELDFRSGLIGIVAGALVVYAISWAYYLVRRSEGMGFGDVKLLAVIGGWLGYQAILPTLFLGSIAGSLVGLMVMVATKQYRLNLEVPFGPFLALGAMSHYLFSEELRQFFVYP